MIVKPRQAVTIGRFLQALKLFHQPKLTGNAGRQDSFIICRQNGGQLKIILNPQRICLLFSPRVMLFCDNERQRSFKPGFISIGFDDFHRIILFCFIQSKQEKNAILFFFKNCFQFSRIMGATQIIIIVKKLTDDCRQVIFGFKDNDHISFRYLQLHNILLSFGESSGQAPGKDRISFTQTIKKQFLEVACNRACFIWRKTIWLIIYQAMRQRQEESSI